MIFYLPFPDSRLVVCETILHQRIVLFFSNGINIPPLMFLGVMRDPWTLEVSTLSSFTPEISFLDTHTSGPPSSVIQGQYDQHTYRPTYPGM